MTGKSIAKTHGGMKKSQEILLGTAQHEGLADQMKTAQEMSVFAIGTIAAATCLVSCARPPGGVVAGTALIKGIVQDLSGNTIDPGELHNLIPPRMCPGHFDVRPADVEAAAASKLVIIHDWQQNMTAVAGLLQAAHVSDERVSVLQIHGHWMTPRAYEQAVGSVARMLSEADPANADTYAARAKTRQHEIRAFSEQLGTRLNAAEISRVKVVCSDKQAGFVRWAGFDVVTEFGRPEDMSVADVEDLIRNTRESGAKLIVDNLQSGSTQAGSAIARDAGVIHVVLSNFPGGFEDTETWEKAVEKNIDLLLDAAQRARGRDG